ncbi:MAG: RNA polymerase factor sigma-54 [Caulobacterales bacterium]
MAIGPKLELRQGQSLVMTPQLQQAIKLLQLSNLELAEYIEEELERNPLLDRVEPEGDGPGAETMSDAGDTRGEYEEISLSDGAAIGNAESAIDSDPDTLYGADDSPSEMQAMQAGGAVDWSRASGSSVEFGEELEGALTREISLQEHLDQQLGIAFPGAADRMIGAALIDQVDEMGYCRVDVAEVAARLGASVSDVERVLNLTQRFEPTGIMARDLKECLAIQLAELNRLDPAMAKLLDHLDLVAKREFSKLEGLCGVDRADIEDMLLEVRALNPRPASEFGGAPAQPVIPDVYVREAPGGGWTVELNSDTLPRVLMNQRYFAEVSSRTKSDKERVYVAECAQNASWLIKSLDQRARTILKVGREIVRQQDAFFAFGVRHLRPMNLKVVAQAIEMHESTVSRVTSNKYMSTPRGVFELKYFFSAAIASTDGGEAHSAESVRHRIKALIDAESADEVLSDDRIVEILQEAGVEIARRTVAKYREAMRIPSSVERRRLMAR